MDIDTNAPEIRAAIALAEELIAGEKEDRQIPGLSAGIVYDQDLIWQRGYGYANLEAQIHADKNTVYRVASITKLITATMLMLLRDAGQLNLDDPIEKHLPEFKIRSPYPDARPATFRQVVSHAAGLPREGAHKGWRDMHMPPIEKLLDYLAADTMRLPSMSEPKYSNIGIALLGHTLSQIAGQDYSRYVQANILGPLSMTSSGFERSQYDEDHYAVGYNKRDDGPVPAPHWDEQGFRPAGGMYSTVEDISKFIALQFREGRAGGSQILGSSTLCEMHMPVNIAPDFESGFGIGWGMRREVGHKVIGHSGGLPGYTTNISLVPALKLAVIVFTNTGTVPAQISTKALEILIPAFQRQQARQEAPASAEEIVRWKAYLGEYAQVPLTGHIRIEIIDDKLMLTAPGADPKTQVRLLPHDGDRFLISGGPHSHDYLTFEVDASGRSTGLMYSAYPMQRVEA